MTSRRKGGLRGKVKKKAHNSEISPFWSKIRECGVDLERLDIDRIDHKYIEWIDSKVDKGLKRKLSSEDNETGAKKSKIGKSMDAKTKLESTSKKNTVGTKKGMSVGNEDQIFIDFELGKSRRISEISTLLRSSGKSKQFSSLPPKY